MVWWAFDQYEREYGVGAVGREISVRAVVSVLLALTGFGILLGTVVKPLFNQPTESVVEKHQLIKNSPK